MRKGLSGREWFIPCSQVTRARCMMGAEAELVRACPSLSEEIRIIIVVSKVNKMRARTVAYGVMELWTSDWPNMPLKMLCLQQAQGGTYNPYLQPEKIVLKSTVTRIGRSEQHSDVVIDSSLSPLMNSRVHAEIRDFKIHYGEMLLRLLWPRRTRLTMVFYLPVSND